MAKKRGRTVVVKLPQTGTSKIAYDRRREALTPRKRRSRTGKIYYERRKNRSDRSGLEAYYRSLPVSRPVPTLDDLRRALDKLGIPYVYYDDDIPEVHVFFDDLPIPDEPGEGEGYLNDPDNTQWWLDRVNSIAHDISWESGWDIEDPRWLDYSDKWIFLAEHD